MYKKAPAIIYLHLFLSVSFFLSAVSKKVFSLLGTLALTYLIFKISQYRFITFCGILCMGRETSFFRGKWGAGWSFMALLRF